MKTLLVLVICIAVISFYIIKSMRKKKTPEPKAKLINLGDDSKIIEFVYADGMGVSTTSTTMVDQLIGLRLFLELTTINLNPLASGQAFVHGVYMKQLAHHMWSGKVIVPSLENAKVICHNIAVINRALTKLGRQEIPFYEGLKPPTSIWFVDKDSKYFDGVCKNPTGYSFEVFWQHIKKCLKQVILISEKQLETKSDYDGTLIGILYRR